MPDKTERRASLAMKIAFRVFINVALVWFLAARFGTFFVLQGGVQAVALTGLILAALNFFVVPILNVMALPVRFVAWIVALLLVNAAALWITVAAIEALNVSGVSLAIGGGVVGWIVISVLLGAGNWVVRAVLR